MNRFSDCKQRPEAGNALFLILIALALFAALSYAVTTSSRSGGNVDREQAEINSASLYQYIASLRATVQRMALTNGSGATSLMFNNDVYTSYDGSLVLPMGTPSAAAASNYVFHPDGGGMPALTFEEMSENCGASHCTDGSFPSAGHVKFYYANLEDVGSDEADIIAVIFSPTSEVCKRLNNSAGIEEGSIALHLPSSPYQTSSSVNAPPTGLSKPSGAASSRVAGKQEFCYYYTNSSGTGTAYSGLRIAMVLWPR